MAIPFYTHSGMAGAPQFSGAAREIANALAACLVNGFNTLAPTSAVAAGGVLTLNYGTAHGYEALVHIQVSGASVAQANGTFRVATVPAGNQLTCAIPGLPDGAVGGTISTKVAGAGWTEPFAANSSTRVFRMGGGNMRYLRIVQSAGLPANARAYETMTALSSGTGLFPSTAQQAGNGVPFVSNSAFFPGVGWWALAGPTFFYFHAYDTVNPGSYGAAAFGDLVDPVKAGDAFNTFLFGFWLNDAAYMARTHTGSAGSVLAQLVVAGGTTLTQPSPISAGKRFLFGLPVEAAGAVRGLLPGMSLALPHAAPTSVGVLLDNVTGISGRVQHVHVQLGTGAQAVALDEDWA